MAPSSDADVLKDRLDQIKTANLKLEKQKGDLENENKQLEKEKRSLQEQLEKEKRSLQEQLEIQKRILQQEQIEYGNAQKQKTEFEQQNKGLKQNLTVLQKELQEIKNSQQEVKSKLETCTTQSKKLKTLNQNYLKFYKNIKDKSTLSLKVLEKNRRRSQLVQNLISSPYKDDLVNTCQQQKENLDTDLAKLCEEIQNSSTN